MVYTIPLEKEVSSIDVKKGEVEDKITALHFESAQGMSFLGEVSPGLYPVVYTGERRDDSIWYGHSINESTIETNGDMRIINRLTLTKTNVRIIVFTKELIEKCLRDVFSKEEISKALSNRAYQLTEEGIKQFVDIHSHFLEGKRVANEELKLFCIRLFSSPSPLNHPVKKRAKVVESAINLMNAHIKDPLSIKEIGFQLNISDRTLELAFKEYLNLTPKQYYRRLLLVMIESELRANKEVSISNVIQQYEIYNLSQFGANFKDYFDKRPSDIAASKEEMNPFGWNEKIFV